MRCALTSESAPAHAHARVDGVPSSWVLCDDRAPELFDMPSRFALDERVDVWSLGCLLYFLCYGVSPFERVSAPCPLAS